MVHNYRPMRDGAGKPKIMPEDFDGIVGIVEDGAPDCLKGTRMTYESARQRLGPSGIIGVYCRADRPNQVLCLRPGADTVPENAMAYAAWFIREGNNSGTAEIIAMRFPLDHIMRAVPDPSA